MRVPRIYVDAALTVGSRVTLDERATAHLSKVLRLRPPAPLLLFNGRGGEYPAVLEAAGKQTLVARVEQHVAVERESGLQLTLAQCVAKGEKMDYTIQKAVELGVQSIIPVESARTVVQLSGERLQRRSEHWQSIIVHACEQCGRNRLPTLAPLQAFNDLLAMPERGPVLILSHRASQGLRQLPVPAGAVTLLVGPEGGWSEAELDIAADYDCRPLALGPRIMRTETAAVAAISAMQALWGDLGA